jgi:hypothetical protein
MGRESLMKKSIGEKSMFSKVSCEKFPFPGNRVLYRK